MKRLLQIEDSKVDALEAQAAMEVEAPGQFQFTICQTIESALVKLEEEEFDVISLDLNLPDAQKLTGLKRLSEYAKNIPLIILTGDRESPLALEAIALGAQDFITKGALNYGSVLARVVNFAIERKKQSFLSIKALENEQQALLNAKLRQDEFLDLLAHDVKNPLVGAQQVLTSILSSAKDDLSPLYYESLLSLRRSNQSLLLILSNLIEVYNLEAGMREFVFENANLIRLVDDVIDNFKYLLESADMDLVKHDFPDAFMARLDTSAFIRIFSNLLHNVTKFGKKGSLVNLYFSNDENSFKFEVESTGAPIKDEDKQFLFTRFKRSLLSQEHFHSSGLGLYLCKNLLDAHQGSIECISDGEKTRLIVKIPRINGDT